MAAVRVAQRQLRSLFALAASRIAFVVYLGLVTDIRYSVYKVAQ